MSYCAAECELNQATGLPYPADYVTQRCSYAAAGCNNGEFYLVTKDLQNNTRTYCTDRCYCAMFTQNDDPYFGTSGGCRNEYLFYDPARKLCFNSCKQGNILANKQKCLSEGDACSVAVQETISGYNAYLCQQGTECGENFQSRPLTG